MCQVCGRDIRTTSTDPLLKTSDLKQQATNEVYRLYAKMLERCALLCPGAGWRPNECQLPPDRLQKQIVGLTDRVFVCASQSVAAVNNIALVSLSAGREAYGPRKPQDGLQFPGSPAPSSSYASQ
ncbi:unnamed protein product [Boreogadus saida]